MNDDRVVLLERRVAELEAQVALLWDLVRAPPVPPGPETDPELVRLLGAYNLLEAVRRYRTLTGADLVESKRAVEALAKKLGYR